MLAPMESGSEVSIHALVQRATEFDYFDLGFSLVSIHALVQRATPYHVA